MTLRECERCGASPARMPADFPTVFGRFRRRRVAAVFESVPLAVHGDVCLCDGCHMMLLSDEGRLGRVGR